MLFFTQRASHAHATACSQRFDLAGGGFRDGGWSARRVASAGPYIFITLDSPTGDPTQPFGINFSSRQVSATAEPASLLDQGLIFNNGVGTTYLVPGSINTDFYQINNAGQIAGDYFGARRNISCRHLQQPEITPIHFLPDMAPYLYNLAGGINNKGLIVGNFFPDGTFTNAVGWLYNGAVKFRCPLPVASVEGTITQSVNDAGLVVGYYVDSNGVNHGFVYDGTDFTTIDPPGSTDTLLFGINNAGIITGRFFDAAGVRHGFLDDNGVFTIIDFPGGGNGRNSHQR